jgi:hypothetical protein
MSHRHAAKPLHLGPDGLKTIRGTPILGASVEAKRVRDLCTADAPSDGARERILAWLAEGAREVTWALCSLPRERWAATPPSRLSDWPALRHARHLALREVHLLPTIRQALGEAAGEAPLSTAAIEHADAAWDPAAAIESAEAIVRGLGEVRFELLQRLESAPDEVWERPLPVSAASDTRGVVQPVQLGWLMLDARRHELEHLSAIWRVVLYWDRVSPAAAPAASSAWPDGPITGLPLHPADRLEESH